jgi:HPt (histidine-containing phosphotransfer) domain-containing protein
MMGARELVAACVTMEDAARQGRPEDAATAQTAMKRALGRIEAHLAATTRATEGQV